MPFDRTSMFLFRMTEQEHDHLRYLAAHEGISMCEWIRLRIGFDIKGNRGGPRNGAGRPSMAALIRNNPKEDQ